MSVPVPVAARLHLLRAHEAPVIVVIRRGPSKLFHIIKWNTKSDELEYGSWFSGKLYPMRCDVSFDGKWMVYEALGARTEWWNGCCVLPFLKTYLEGDNSGGGYWKDAQTLMLRGWVNTRGQVPFETRELELETWKLTDLHSLKMERDGWKRNTVSRSSVQKIEVGGNKTRVGGNEDWNWQFNGEGPTLQCFNRGSLNNDLGFKFRLPEHPELLDENVQWATFDARGHLVVARAGWIERYSPANVKSGRPGFRLDLNGLTRPTSK